MVWEAIIQTGERWKQNSKKAMVRVNVPVGLLVTAFGIGLMVLVGSYLIKYFRGAVPLREVYGTEQAGG